MNEGGFTLQEKQKYILEHPRSLFLFGTLLFLLGSYTGSTGKMTLWMLLFSIILLSGVWTIGFARIWIVGWICLSLGSLWGWHSYNLHTIRENFLREVSGNYMKTMNLTGHIVSGSRKMDRYKVYRLQIDTIDIVSPPISTHIWAKVPSNLTIKEGDILHWRGKIRSLYSGRGQSYRLYGFLSRTYAESTLYLFTRNPAITQNILSIVSIRESFLKRILTLFPKDSSGLLAGIIIGNTDFISEATIESFRRTGLSHILAVSGSNVAFLLLLLEKIIRYFRMKKIWRILIITFFLIFYMLLTGLDVPVIRATIMGLLVYIGFSFDRKIESISLLFLVMLMFTIYEPLSVVHDLSFMLSCVATLSILVWKDTLAKKFSWIPNGFFIRESTTISTAATLATAPILIHGFGSVALYGIFTNILVGPVVGIIMGIGIFTVMVSYISFFCAFVLGFPAYVLIQYILKLASFMQRIDPNIRIVPELGSYTGIFLALSIFYIFMATFVLIWERILQNQKKVQQLK